MVQKERFATRVRRKSIRLASKILMAVAMPWIIAAVLAVRLLRPLVFVRFGYLESSRVGHLGFETDMYFCEHQSKINSPRSVDILYFSTRVCNRQLERMIRRKLFILPLARYLEKYNRKIPGGAKHQISISFRDKHGTRDLDGLIARSPCQFHFTAKEEQHGKAELERLGIPPGAPFVCMHNRDSTYLESLKNGGKDYGYHRFRDFSVQDLAPAALELVRRGYYVVRVGKMVAEPLETDSSKIIDYASLGPTDFLDIYLPSQCSFFIGNTAGLVSIPTMFRKPVLHINIVPFEQLPTWGTSDIVLPKLYRELGTGRLLSFAEVIECGAGNFLKADEFHRHGIEVVNNAPQEILEAAKEMDDRLHGDWASQPSDEMLQESFRRLLKDSPRHSTIYSRLGASFSRKYDNLLAPIDRSAAGERENHRAA